MSRQPALSVVMSVLNGRRYLGEAVDSILGQSFRDFEFIIIDDGATDGSGHLLDVYAQKDPRIRVIHQENRGLTSSLNIGLGFVRGPYVARMDADDVSEATRLARQVEFLDRHADHIAVGTSAHVIDEGGRIVGRINLGGEDRELAVRFLADNFMIHGSVMFRGEHNVRYNNALRYAQDFDLWVRLRVLGKIANLSEPLYQWRQHSGAISARKTTEQKRIARWVADEHLQGLLKQRQYDLVFEGYVRSIGGAARSVELRNSLAAVTSQDAEMRLRCSHVLAMAECSARRAVADFSLWLRLLGIWNASRTLLSILCHRAGRRLFGRRSKEAVERKDDHS